MIGYSLLSRVIELEALTSGVTARSSPELAPFDSEALEADADDQLAFLGRMHEWASSQAFEGGVFAPFYVKLPPADCIRRDSAGA